METRRSGGDTGGLERVCVFCGSQKGSDPVYLDLARTVGRALAERRLGLVYGGARVGTMGALADAALEAGGTVYGVLPHRLRDRELAHPGLHALHLVETMHERKAKMADLADGFCVLPGGFGTLDEAFEALTWNQLGYHRKPVAFLGPNDFWSDIVAHADRALRAGFVTPEHRALFYASSSVDEALDYLELLGRRPRGIAAP